jgi:hypothetical protein
MCLDWQQSTSDRLRVEGGAQFPPAPQTSSPPSSILRKFTRYRPDPDADDVLGAGVFRVNGAGGSGTWPRYRSRYRADFADFGVAVPAIAPAFYEFRLIATVIVSYASALGIGITVGQFVGSQARAGECAGGRRSPCRSGHPDDRHDRVGTSVGVGGPIRNTPGRT